MHLGVPPARYGTRPPDSTSSVPGDSAPLSRCRSSEDVSPRCRRTQFRLAPLAAASSVSRISRLQTNSSERDSPVLAAAAAAAVATATAAVTGGAEPVQGVSAPLSGGAAAGASQPSWRGSAEERRRCFQRRLARWETHPAEFPAEVAATRSSDDGQDVRDVANCVRLDAKGDAERWGDCSQGSPAQNGAVSDHGRTGKVGVLLQTWMERLERLSLHARREELDSSAAGHGHPLDESLRPQFRPSPGDAKASGHDPSAELDPVCDSDPLDKAPDGEASSPPATPPTPTGDWVPTFVVSDCNGTAWPEPWAELLGGGGGGRRLSAVSDCSTVSSIGWDRSRRGSLLDLDTEGLQLDADGRLERAVRPEGAAPPERTEAQTAPSVQPRAQEPLRKVSEPEERRGQRIGETCRKVSSWSYSSVSTLSQDEEEELLATTPTPSAPGISKVRSTH